MPGRIALPLSRSFVLLALLVIAAVVPPSDAQTGATVGTPTASQVLRVGVVGSQPFVVNQGNGFEGIAVEIWQAIAERANLSYRFQPFDSVATALDALRDGKLDVAVGPISVTASRAREVGFSQPYFQSSLSILSSSESPSAWQRLQPFFSPSFFIAIAVLLFVLALVGTFIWLAERKTSSDQFPYEPGPGIANGIWLAIVTMTTVGYGDRTPRTFIGRVIAGIWMVVSLVTATSLVAGIASTLTLTGLQTNLVSTAEQLHGKKIAVVTGSTAGVFARRYGAQIVNVSSIAEGAELVRRHSVQGMVFDRPELLYFQTQHHDSLESVSKAEYDHQGYAFAFPLSSQALIHTVNLHLLRMEESGRTDRIVHEWLGEEAQN